MKSGELYTFGPYSLALSSRLLARSGEAVTLAPKTFDLLAALVKSDGRLLSKDELMGSLWPGTFVEEANLSFQISTLRRALGEDGAQWIETVPKHGYRFTAEVKTPVEAESSMPPEEKAAPRNRRWYLPAAALAVGITLIAVFLERTASRTSRKPEAFSPAVPLTAYPGYEVDPSLSPDGSQVAFSWNGPTGDNSDIYVKLAGPGQPLRLTTNRAWEDSPAWSPDGRLIAFERSNSDISADVFVIPALGGAERKIATINPRGAGLSSAHRWKLPPNLAWTPDAKWIAFGGRASDDEEPGIWLVALEGGEKRRLTKIGGHEFGDWGPAFSPDGRNLAFIRERTLSASSVYVLPLSSTLVPVGLPKKVTRERAAVQGLAWMSDGSGLVFSSAGHLGLSRMQSITLAAAEAEPAHEPQPLPFGEHATGFSISRSGRIVYAAEFRDTNLWKLALSGPDRPAVGPLAASTFDEETPDYSPDGKRLAFASTRSGAEEIWISGSDGSDPIQLTSMGGPQCANPRWSPDGRVILFTSRREGSADLYLLRPDTGEMRRITDDAAEEVEPRWSRDGRTIYFGSNRTGRFEVWKMPESGGAAVRITRQGGSRPPNLRTAASSITPNTRVHLLRSGECQSPAERKS